MTWWRRASLLSKKRYDRVNKKILRTKVRVTYNLLVQEIGCLDLFAEVVVWIGSVRPRGNLLHVISEETNDMALPITLKKSRILVSPAIGAVGGSVVRHYE
jgi:hypothetical protein